MDASLEKARATEFNVPALSGWMMLFFALAAKIGGLILVIRAVNHQDVSFPLWCGLGLALLASISYGGFFTLQPNEARVLVLFGAYKGTVRTSGFHWTNPFNRKIRISLRARNLNGEKLKVNDKRGNPIEIAAVVVWRVEDTAQAMFDVEQYSEYVRIQSESA